MIKQEYCIIQDSSLNWSLAPIQYLYFGGIGTELLMQSHTNQMYTEHASQ